MSSAAVPAAAPEAGIEDRIERISRNGPRSSSSAATATGVKPISSASSVPASSRRVFPIPGSPSRVIADSPSRAEVSSDSMACSSASRPTTEPDPRRIWNASGHSACRTGSETRTALSLIGRGPGSAFDSSAEYPTPLGACRSARESVVGAPAGPERGVG